MTLRGGDLRGGDCLIMILRGGDCLEDVSYKTDEPQCMLKPF